MAIALGTENKRQVYLVAGLFVVVAIIAAWELHGAFTGPAPARLPATPASASIIGAPGTTRRPDIAGIEPKLQTGSLARSERVEYESTGRNIFSGESKPVKIETPIAPARPIQDVANTAPPEPTGPPAIDLHYLGYVQSSDKSYDALFTHQDETFIARSGEIMFHRYKVGTINPTGVQVTDLRFNNTQTIAVTEK